MFEGFARRRIATSGAEINLLVGGEGPPLLLLHGFPQSHVMWHRIAPALAERFTVVATDLRGYGDSEKLPGDADHGNYSKRLMALDQVEVMRVLGFERFHVVGHDRGGRVAHRMALDHRDRVERLVLLDIVPTLTLFETVNQAIATDYYHWFFLAQPHGLPEHLIGLDPEFFLRRTLGSWGSGGLGLYGEAALNEYQRCIRDPATIHAMCEDYRAAASIDLFHDRADRAVNRRITCPLLVLWGLQGIMEKHYNVLETWRSVATDVHGSALNGGHFLAEELPEETLDALTDFLR